jgi:LacI family transcriptional regulator
MLKWNPKGMIVLQSRFAEVKSLGISTVVAIGTRKLGTSHCQIVCANDAIGRMGAKALIGLGIKHFAYCGLAGLEFSDNRSLGFNQILKESGHSAAIYVSPRQSLTESWYLEERRLARWLLSLPKPAGLMACNDDRARMLAEVCRLSGILVPDEIAILGVDNDEQVCGSANPPLSSIALAAERGGYEAAALLDSMMCGNPLPNKIVVVHPTRVVQRQSTDILAVENVAIVRALRFVRENSNRSLRVPDLATVAGLSRRALQDRFKQFLGRTPAEEIHRCRGEQVARLLVETNLGIGEIASASGFDSDAHLARYFARQIGMTPSFYRKTHRMP